MRSPSHVSLSLCLALLVGCTGERHREADRGGDDTVEPGPTTDLPVDTDTDTDTDEPTVPLETVEERLAALGVETPGLDELGPAITDRSGRLMALESHPLRDPVATLQGASEFVVVGPGGGADVVDFDQAGLGGSDPEHVVARLAGAFELWADPQVVSVHADADGREETVVVDVRPSAAGPADVFLWMAEDADAGFANPYGLLGTDIGDWEGASDLALARYDVEGDGVDEVLMLARVGEGWELRTLAPLTATVGPVLAAGELVPAELSGEALIGVSVATGQLDGDPAMEVTLAIDTRPDPYGPSGHSRLVVLDEQGGALSPVLDEILLMGDGRPVVGAGVAFADIDADFVDELVVGGVELGVDAAAYHQLVVVLEDLVEPATALLPVYEGEFTSSLPNGNATIRFLDTQVRAGSASAVPMEEAVAFDAAEDVLVNNVLWEFTTVGLADPADPVIALQPREVFDFDGADLQIDLSSDVVQFALGHFDGDGIADAAVYAVEDLFVGADGAALPAGGLFVRSVVGGVNTQRQTVLRPDVGFPARLAPANVDTDSIVVQYLSEGHAVVFSEPVILAAIAAPPCYAGPMGQNTGNCTATLGASSSTSVSAEDSMSVTAGLHVGFSVADRLFTQSELEAKVTVEATAATGFGESSSLSFSRAYSNGSDQDQVLATVVGFEQFHYQVLSAPPGEDGTSLVGETLVVSIPRPDTVTTALYSEDLIRPSMRQSQRDILDRVFTHERSEPFTYVRADELPALVSALGVAGAGCDEHTPASELETCGWLTHDEQIQTPVVSGPISGVGSSEAAALSVGTETDQWTRWGVSNKVSLELTGGGVMIGASVGTAYESTVSVTHGETVEYGLEIGAIDPEVYEPYSAAIYAYNVQFDCVSNALGEEECDGFQVLGFTVE